MTQSVFTELQKPAPSAIIELFELQLFQKLHGSSETYYFHSGSRLTDPQGGVYWAGRQYMRFPVEAEGFEYSGNGQLPRPKIRISNVLNTMSAILLTINTESPGNDLTGAKVTRIRTLAKFLDAINFPGGVNPYGTPDSSAELPREIYYIDRKTAENKEYVEFELAAAFDLAGVRAPRRQCIANLCQWEYRGPECGYTGSTGYDANDNPITLISPPNFSGGSAFATVGTVLNVGEYLKSSNGWYKAIMQATGEFVVYAKNNKQVWSSLSTAQADWGALYLRVRSSQVTINRVLGDAEVWSTNTKNDVTGFEFVTWLPTNLTKGRQAAFLWEIFGKEPDNIGATRTKSYEFVQPSRSLTVTYTAQVTDAGPNHYSGRRKVWTLVSEAYKTRSGTYNTGSQTVNATVTVSANNPYRDTPETTLTEVGRRYNVIGATGNVSYFGLQDDGNLVLVEGSGDITWQSGYSSLAEPKYAGPSDPGLDVCGKRLTSCEKRFGFDQVLPFGSFPGVGTYYT